MSGRVLVDQYIPLINVGINGYLKKLSPHIEFRLTRGYQSISLTCSKDVSYGNLSRGEKLRIDLAVSLAFKDFLGSSGVGCNLICIDELLDSGGDTQFMLNSFGIIKHMPESLFLITHREELMTEVDQSLIATKQNGFTTLVTETE